MERVHSKIEGLKSQHQLLIVGIISCIIGLLMVILMLIPYLPFLSAQINKLSIPLILSPKVLKLLIVILALLILLINSKNIKNYLHKHKLNKLEMYKKFKTIPKEYTDKILLIILKHRKLTWCEICINLNNNKQILLKHILSLQKTKYIKLHNPKNIKIATTVTNLPYKITRKGKKYLKSNNLSNSTL